MNMLMSTIERRARGAVDLTALPDEVRDRLEEHKVDPIDAGVVVRQRGDLLEARRARLEHRVDDDGNVILDGYATAYEYPYEVAGGPPWGWVETMADGCFRKSVAERDDVKFLFDHEGLVLARRSREHRTLELESDEHGLRVEAVPNPKMTFAADVISMVDRGDVDEMSLAFRAIRQEWNDDYTERRIIEAKLFDVSAVSYPANPATVIQARGDGHGQEADDDAGEGRLSVVLASAMADAARFAAQA